MLLLYFSKLKLLAGSATTNSPAHHSLACGIKHSKQRFVYLNSYILLHEYFEHAILFSLQVTPLPVTDIQFVNPKHASKRKQPNDNDVAVQPSKRRTEQDTGPHHCPKICKDRLYHAVHDLLPNACLFTIIAKESFEACEENDSQLMSEKHPSRGPIADPNDLCESAGDDDFTCPIIYDNIEESSTSLSDEIESSSTSDSVGKQPEATCQVLPSPLTELYSEEYRSMSSTSVSKRAIEIFRSLSLSQKDCNNIERSTQLQRESEDWHKQRQGRLTASIFHDVLVKKNGTSCESLVKKCVVKTDISHIPAIKWGIDHENEGRIEYIHQLEHVHQQFVVSCAGLIIHPSFPHLGASPDGFTECACCGKGLVEIKCPFSYKNGTPDDMIGKRGSFLNHQGLVKSHKYYTQVQGQLATCDREFCDFVVWTPQKTIVQRIYKDFAFIDKLFRKLTSFYVEHVLPELLTRHIQEPRSCESDTHLYCFCQEQEHGDMIECENTDCQYQWFHFSCIGINQAPIGSWYCHDCQRSESSSDK